MWSFQTDSLSLWSVWIELYASAKRGPLIAQSYQGAEQPKTIRTEVGGLTGTVTGRTAGLDLKYLHTEWKRTRKRLASEGCNDASYCYYCAWYEIYFQSEIAFGFAFVFAFCLSVTRLYDLIMNHWRLTIRLHYCPIIVRTFPSVSQSLCNFLLKQECVLVGCVPPALYRTGDLCVGVSVQRALCQGDPIPSPCGQTDACENITLP